MGKGLMRLLVLVSLCGFVLASCGQKPQSLSLQEIKKQANSDFVAISSTPEPLQRPVDLYEAIARAILFNREHKLAAMEAALSQRQLDLANMDLLPALALRAGYSMRDQYAASVSTTFNGDEPDPLPDQPVYSVSQDKQRATAGAELSWNLLDFGLSYVRAGQNADRRMVALERQRKVAHNISREVRAAYFKAIAAQNLLSELAPLLRRVDRALEDSRQIERRRLSSPTDALLYQKELLEIRRTLHTQQRVLMTAKLELGQLMGLLPGQDYRLAKFDYIIPEIAMNMALMERSALINRPELMEAQYQQRLSRREVRASILSMLPSITLNANFSYDDSDYLKYSDSAELAAQMNWNLFSVFSASAARRVAEARVSLAEAQRLALSMAVLSQVHIANMNFAQARREYETSERFLDVSQRLTRQTRDAQRVAKFGELEVIRQEASLLLANMRRDIAFAELQNSYGAIYASIGLDIVPDNINTRSVDDLTRAIENNLQNWMRKYTRVVGGDQDVITPIQTQSPRLGPDGFVFNERTFSAGQNLRYYATRQDGTSLPNWLKFDASARKFFGTPPQDAGNIPIRVIAQYANLRVSDSFILEIPKTGIARQPVAAVPPAIKPTTSLSSRSAQARKPAPAAQSKPKAKPAKRSGTASRFVQIRAFTKYEDAKSFAASSERITGLKAFIRKTKKRNPPLYRIIIPAFNNAEVQSVLAKVREAGITDAFVTRD
jgi:outer membrane protein TolC